MELPPGFNVLGVGVHALDLPTATAQLVAAAPRHERRLVCCCDAHSVLHARRDPAHRRTLNQAFLATPDVPFGVAAGVGAAFDFLSGRGRQAPPRVSALGLEWLWRLAHEPRRLGRRYFVTVPGFTARVAA